MLLQIGQRSGWYAQELHTKCEHERTHPAPFSIGKRHFIHEKVIVFVTVDGGIANTNLKPVYCLGTSKWPPTRLVSQGRGTISDLMIPGEEKRQAFPMFSTDVTSYK